MVTWPWTNIFLNQMIEFRSNNSTNLHHLTTHSTMVLPTKWRSYCDHRYVTSFHPVYNTNPWRSRSWPRDRRRARWDTVGRCATSTRGIDSVGARSTAGRRRPARRRGSRSNRTRGARTGRPPCVRTRPSASRSPGRRRPSTSSRRRSTRARSTRPRRPLAPTSSRPPPWRRRRTTTSPSTLSPSLPSASHITLLAHCSESP